MTKTEAKSKIEDFEFYQNGYGMLSGHGVKVMNLKKLKKGYKADVILFDYCDNIQERHNNLFYPNKLFTKDLTNEK